MNMSRDKIEKGVERLIDAFEIKMQKNKTIKEIQSKKDSIDQIKRRCGSCVFWMDKDACPFEKSHTISMFTQKCYNFKMSSTYEEMIQKRHLEVEDLEKQLKP